MGCSQSKIENEEAVSRCKDRKLIIKDAVTARNAFAAAHTAYAMSLKNCGAALSDYAHGEVQNSQLGPVHPNPSVSVASSSFDTLPPPPPPLPSFTASPLQRAATMPEIKIPSPDPKPMHNPKPFGPTIEEEDENEIENEGRGSVGGLRRRKSNRGRNAGVDSPPPPLPPDRTTPADEHRPVTPLHQHDSTWDYFFSVENIPGPSLSVVEEVNVNKNEIDRKGFSDAPKRVSVDESADVEEARIDVAAAPVPEPPHLPATPAPAAKSLKKVKQAGNGGPNMEGKKIANLLHIFVELDDHFLKASESAHEVSKMLEATRLHYHSNFADNRGHIDHSARVMRVLTFNRSFRGIPNADDGKDDFYTDEQETHASVLDKLLAWEKKLYDEVKAGEIMKFEYQRKVNELNKLKKRGSNSEASEKVKAAVSHLHTRYIVDMQAMDSTVAEINRLRDGELYPKLIQLVDGMATMWETMQAHHDSQSKIVTALRSLDLSLSHKETSEHHYNRTAQLWAIAEMWHQQLEKLFKEQRDYIKALNHWLKLSLIPIESNLKEKVSSPPRIQTPPIQNLLFAWQDHLERLPDEILKTAIFTFRAVINTIMHQQEDEMKMKSKCEKTRKELSRKTRHFEDWYNKYVQKRGHDDLEGNEMEEETGSESVIAEKQFAVDVVRKRLEEEVEAYQRQCLQVRERSLASLKTHLPELFRALSEFSAASVDMFSDLRSLSQYQNSGKNHA